MRKFQDQITKAQEEHKSNNEQPDLPMYKATDLQRPEDILPPTYDVIIKNARLEKREKCDKLMSNALSLIREN